MVGTGDADHTAYLWAHYRLLRNVALWLTRQAESWTLTNVGGEVWCQPCHMNEHARDWWDIAHSVWYELRAQHDGQSPACLCPSCTERQAPLLKRAGGTPQ